MGEEPFIVPLIRWTGRVLGYLFFLVALPTLLCAARGTPLVVGALVALPRFAVLWLAGPWCAAQPVVVWLVLAAAGASRVARGCAAAGWVVAAAIGLVFSQLDPFLRRYVLLRKFLRCGKSARLGGYWWHLVESLKDLLAFCALCGAAVSVVRVPALLVLAAHAGAATRRTNSRGYDSHDLPVTAGERTVRLELFYTFAMAFVDLATLPFALVLAACFWRAVGLRKWVDAETHWDAFALVDYASVRGQVVKRALSGLLDIPCFLLSLTFLLAPWRFAVFSRLHEKKSIDERRVMVLREVGQAWLDIFAMIASVPVALTLYRLPALLIPACKREFKAGGEAVDAQHRRSMAWSQLALIFVDIFTLFWSAPIILVTIYRIPILVRKWKKPTSNWSYKYNYEAKCFDAPSAQGRAIVQAARVWYDIPFFAMALVLFCSWRSCHYIGKLWHIDHDATPDGEKPRKYRARMRRHTTLAQFGQFLIDVPIIVMAAVVTAFMLWRAPIMWYQLTRPGRTTSDRRWIVVMCFLKFWVELPLALLALVVTGLLWRAFFMWRDLARNWKRTDYEHKWSKSLLIILKHFGLLFIDLFDFPFAMLSLLIVVTLWRLHAFVRALRACTTRNQGRKAVLKELVLWLLDIPTFLAAALVVATVYRAPTMFRALRWHFKNYFSKGNTQTEATAPPVVLGTSDAAAADEENPAPAASNAAEADTTWHKPVWANAGLVLLDVPFPVLLLLTVWRMPLCIKRLISECGSAKERRVMILKYLLLVLKDIPCSVPLFLMLVTGWRIPTLVKMFRELERGDDEHKNILKIFWQWLIDCPFALLFLWAFCFPWRTFGLVRKILSLETVEERRKMIVQYSAIVFPDIAVGFLSVVVAVFFFWRGCYTYRKFKKYLGEWSATSHWRHTFSFYCAVMKATKEVIIDLPFIPMGLFVLPFVWRSPAFLYYIFVTHWEKKAPFRRCMAAQYFGMVFLDILFVLGLFVVLVSPWRWMTFKRAIASGLAEYTAWKMAVEEENHWKYSFTWYASVATTCHLVAFDWPFIVMGLVVVCCPWRAPMYLWRVLVSNEKRRNFWQTRGDVYKIEPEIAEDEEYRWSVTLDFFLHSIADLFIFWAALGVFLVSPWRLHSFAHLYRIRKDKIVREMSNPYWLHAFQLYYSVLWCWMYSVRDWWSIFQTLVVALGAQHLPCLLRTCVELSCLKLRHNEKMRQLHRSAEEQGEPREHSSIVARVRVAPETRELWKRRVKPRLVGEEPKTAPLPLSPSVYVEAVQNEFVYTLQNVPQLLLLPVKVAALLALPVYYYIAWRLGALRRRPTDGDAGAADGAGAADPVLAAERYVARSLTLSFVAYPAKFMLDLCSERLSFACLHQLLVGVCLAGPLMLWNELAFAPLALNHALLLLLTWADPLWRAARRRANYSLGAAPSAAWEALEVALMVSQALLLPAAAACQLLLPLLPVCVLASLKYDAQPGFAEFWRRFFGAAFWRHQVAHMDAWMWALCGLWWAALPPCWHLTFKQRRLYEMFDPLNAYVLVAKRVLAGTLWKGYRTIIVECAMWCYATRHTCCCLGQWVVMLAFVLWAYWPFVAVGIARAALWRYWYSLFLFAVPASAFLTWKGYFAVKLNWKEQPRIVRQGLSDVVITGEFPQGGGIRLSIRATKPAELTIKQAILKIESDEFWRLVAQVVKGGQQLVSTFKILLYPVKLVPDYLNAQDFAAGRTDLSTAISFGTEGRWKIKKKLVLRYAQAIVERGDPEVRLVVEFGVKGLRWQRYGTLCEATTRLSVLLHCVEHGLPLPMPGAPAAPAAPAAGAADAAQELAEGPAPPAVVEVAEQSSERALSPPPPPPPPPPRDASPESARPRGAEDDVPTAEDVERLQREQAGLLEVLGALGIERHVLLAAVWAVERDGAQVSQQSVLDAALAEPLPGRLQLAAGIVAALLQP
eukprot:m51a1_g6158 hypothetical protein (1933) ;mRNA; f:322974-330132